MTNDNSALKARNQALPLIDEGTALAEVLRLEPAPAAPAQRAQPEHFSVVVIGGGQAGLSVGYYLAKLGLRFVILDANARIGDSWRKRWDSLRLFTPARYDSLAGMPFPGPGDAFPTKEQMADYLEAYAARFALPVRSGVRVERLLRRDGKYVVMAGERSFVADHVVVAMAAYQKGQLPAFARELDPQIVQLHSSDYRNPAQLREGAVLIAGAGNSGSEIATELARSRHTIMAGRDTGHVPFRIESFIGRFLLVHIVLRLVFHYLLSVRTPLGRKAKKNAAGHGGPLIRVKPKDLARAGVERTVRVAGVRDGRPVLEDGRVLDVANVIWCTGYEPGFSWIELDVFGEDGAPRHRHGIAETQPGLYFVGLPFLYAMSSTMIHGVARDAARVAKAIAKHAAASR